MEQLEVKETHNLIRWEAAFRMREASCPWTLTKGVLSLSYPKENLIRQFLLEGQSIVDPSRDRTEDILRCQYACSAPSLKEGKVLSTVSILPSGGYFSAPIRLSQLLNTLQYLCHRFLPGVYVI